MPFDALPRLNHINRILEQNQVSPSYISSWSQHLSFITPFVVTRTICMAEHTWLMARCRDVVSATWQTSAFEQEVVQHPCHGHPFHTNFETCQLLLWSGWHALSGAKYLKINSWANGQSLVRVAQAWGLCTFDINNISSKSQNEATPTRCSVHGLLMTNCTTSLSAMNTPGGRYRWCVEEKFFHSINQDLGKVGKQHSFLYVLSDDAAHLQCSSDNCLSMF